MNETPVTIREHREAARLGIEWTLSGWTDDPSMLPEIARDYGNAGYDVQFFSERKNGKFYYYAKPTNTGTQPTLEL